jgi:hypothetical protein
MVVQRKPAIKKVGGKVFALDYGRLMGDPIYSSVGYFLSDDVDKSGIKEMNDFLGVIQSYSISGPNAPRKDDAS